MSKRTIEVVLDENGDRRFAYENMKGKPRTTKAMMAHAEDFPVGTVITIWEPGQ